LVLANSLLSQKNTVLDNNKIDNTIFLFSKRERLIIDSVVSFVNQTFTKEEDKVRAYFSFISLNIDYDVDRLTELKLYSASSFQNHLKASLSESPELVFNRRKAVCEGYSNFMYYFCKKSNINCQLIIGYVKLDDEVKTDILHQWNSVKIDSSWYLLDITWSNGYVNLNNQFVKQFSELYYLKNNEYFIKDHLPLDSMWQLTTSPYSKNFFFSNDTTHRYFFKNFNYKDSIAKFLNLTQEDREIQEFINYSRFDSLNLQFKKNVDVILFNKAIEKYNISTIYYDDFVTYYNNELIKNPTKLKCKKALDIIANSKKEADYSLKVLTNYSFKNTSISSRKEELQNNLIKLMEEVKKSRIAVNKISKLVN
jgi:hypothetical protein